MTHLYLIRHGDAAPPPEAHVLDDPGLTALGITQCERLRDRLAATGELQADVVIASTMLRARQTAEIIAPALGQAILYDDDVQEWRFPEDEMLNVEEYIENFRHVPHDQKPFYQVIPGAESWAQFMQRACTALNRITREHENKTIVVICHGGVIDASFHFFFRLSTIHLPHAYFNTHNTSLTHWLLSTMDDYYPVSWTLERYNDIMHLQDLHSSTRIPWRDFSMQPAEEGFTQEK